MPSKVKSILIFLAGGFFFVTAIIGGGIVWFQYGDMRRDCHNAVVLNDIMLKEMKGLFADLEKSTCLSPSAKKSWRKWLEQAIDQHELTKSYRIMM